MKILDRDGSQSPSSQGFERDCNVCRRNVQALLVQSLCEQKGRMHVIVSVRVKPSGEGSLSMLGQNDFILGTDESEIGSHNGLLQAIETWMKNAKELGLRDDCCSGLAQLLVTEFAPRIKE